MEPDFLLRASTWGRVFEIAVQRGVIAYLVQQDLLSLRHPSLEGWQEYKVADVTQGVVRDLHVTDQNVREWVESNIRHLLVFGYGLGWSTMREYLKRNALKHYQIEAIWAPLSLPGVEESYDEEIEKTAFAFKQAFKLPGPVDVGLLQRGRPGRADFLLWLKAVEASTRRKSKRPENVILCLEFSYNAPPKLADFRTEEPHCNEVHRYARYIESRGVFARVCAEVEGSGLEISQQLSDHLVAFSGSDKPLFKLCQASSYTERLVNLLVKQERLTKGCRASAIAVTSNGLESLTAEFDDGVQGSDPRIQLMASLGEAYRKAHKLKDGARDDLDKEIRIVFNKLVRSLPSDFRKQAKTIGDAPDLGSSLHLSLSEKVKDFYTPMQALSVEDALSSLESTDALEDFFDGDPRPAITTALKQRLSPTGDVTLRNTHAAAVVAGLTAAQPGRLNVIALEGNPGIGKTTAVTQFLSQQDEGYCFLYVSPRVVINRDVTAKLAHNDEGQPSGILTLTSNAKLISSAASWYEQKIHTPGTKKLQIDSAVVADGVAELNHPICNTLFVTPQEEQDIDTEIVASRRYKRARTERADSMQSKTRPGVLRTLAIAARKLLDVNPQVNRLVLTAAIQGYRSLRNQTTIDALSQLFTKKANTTAGKQERRNFAKKIPTVIAMVDEVAGDGAGALFCHGLAEWLTQQFIEPFEGEHCPFRVVLIISDASLSNEVVLNSYLNSGDRAPDKVLISPTAGSSAFRVTGTTLKVGSGLHPTLHIMTNSYPASTLDINYSIRLASITPGLTSDGQPQPIRQAVREQSDEELLRNAQIEIETALKQGAEQIIFFAQDKAFLRQLRQTLTAGEAPQLTPDDVKILDQSVREDQRLKLVQEPQRDQVRVFLMTSSGARGVSFPKTDWIIASIPRFNIEAALMEVAQLIYRGRGLYTDVVTGQKVSGDHKARRLVMLINDFMIVDGSEDRDRRWLRQSTDLLTLLLMLRSTIHTRIKGDAGLQRQRIAFVPVGFVGDEELLSLMSDDLRDFLREAQVFLCDDHTQDDKALIGKAQQLVEGLFAHFNLKGFSPEVGTASYVDYTAIEALAKTISRPTSRLLGALTDESLTIPQELTCVGPFWIEDWRGRTSEERFSFETWRTDVDKGSLNLLGLLNSIADNTSFPPKLRQPAKELHRLLIREKETPVREYSTLQDTKTDNIVVALPLDYPHFWKIQPEDGGRKKLLEDPTTWRNALGTALTSQGLVMPVLPIYQDFPWAAVVGQRTISQLETVFDNRYFMASSELNLLNTILLEDNDEAD
ncbi:MULTISPECIES: helicase [Cyanophyceae]|uniref:Helicase n=1 Tax=Leptolyngbya subtilissima DQ-A4 TaxID=2933933 RepID=A0ABV0K8S4_9CYAN|nr:helicase [Nodosilinea sp. FACHB-141]MBD2110348.1 helicase [Nodosilinea sp. FACHB-141]